MKDMAVDALHLHPQYAWSLLEDFLYSGLVKVEDLDNRVIERLNEGRSARWITEEHRRSARQMLVYADQVLLPMEAGDTSAFTAALGEALLQPHQALREGETSIMEPSREPQAAREQMSTLTSIMHHPEVNEQDIEATLDWWERRNTFEAQHRLNFSVTDQSAEAMHAFAYEMLRDALIAGRPEENSWWRSVSPAGQQKMMAMAATDPRRERGRFERLSRIVSDTVSFALIAERLARRGYPTLASPNVAPALPGRSAVEAEQAVVRLYFKNVRLAVPDTAAEAMKLRKNDRVVHWREKIRAWEASLAKEEIDLKAVVAEIDEACGYIEGARGVKSHYRARAHSGAVQPLLSMPLAPPVPPPSVSLG